MAKKNNGHFAKQTAFLICYLSFPNPNIADISTTVDEKSKSNQDIHALRARAENGQVVRGRHNHITTVKTRCNVGESAREFQGFMFHG